MLTITPRSSSSSGSSAAMSAAASRIMLNVPTRLTRTTRSNAASGIGPSRPTIRPAAAMPAQLTRMRAGPCAVRAVAMAASADGPSLTSQPRPSPPNRRALYSAAVWLMSSSATRQPSRARWAAVAAPSPEPPPLTSAASPWSFMLSLLSRPRPRLPGRCLCIARA